VIAMTDSSLADRIVDTALSLAARRSWEQLRLHDVAAELGIGLNDIRAHFREKEDIVDAWFDRADAAMLAEAERPELRALDSERRLHRLLMAWLGALAPHRRVTRQMILGKLEPGHLHYQVAGLLRVSRTVQWWREAASRDAPLPWRAIEETGLTAVYLMTFFYWMYDDSEGSRRTAAFLERRLREGARLWRWLYAGRSPWQGAREAKGAPSPPPPAAS
jgi:AcrR family transcriptional regulator